VPFANVDDWFFAIPLDGAAAWEPFGLHCHDLDGCYLIDFGYEPIRNSGVFPFNNMGYETHGYLPLFAKIGAILCELFVGRNL
jgi:hypothetical protein